MFGFYDILAIAFLIIAIGTNSCSVYLQKRYRYYDKFGRNGYAIHSVVISIAWGSFVLTEFLAANSSWRLDNAYPVLGYAIMLVALVIFILAFKQIGIHGLGNGNFFGRPLRRLGGIYKNIPEPIYVSYSLWFLGIAFVSYLKVFFLLTIVGFIGLIFIEARVERPYKHKKGLSQ